MLRRPKTTIFSIGIHYLWIFLGPQERILGVGIARREANAGRRRVGRRARGTVGGRRHAHHAREREPPELRGLGRKPPERAHGRRGADIRAPEVQLLRHLLQRRDPRPARAIRAPTINILLLLGPNKYSTIV